MEDKSEDSGSVMMEARTSHVIPVQSEANGEIKKEIEDAGKHDEMIIRYGHRTLVFAFV